MSTQDTQRINPETLEFSRAIKTSEEGYNLCKTTIDNGKSRSEKAAKVEAKMNGEPPFDISKLKAAGEGWRSNRSTGFMSGIVRRQIPMYIDVIDKARVFTQSRLPSRGLNKTESDHKSETFCNETTKVVRKWAGFTSFKQLIARENVTHGRAFSIWTDTFNWQPEFVRNDEIYFPDDTSQDASKGEFFVVKKYYFIHELSKYVKNHEDAQAVGWNVPNLVAAINAAKPTDTNSGTSENLRKYQDAIREANVATSYTNSSSMVEVNHLFIAEADGRVSHHIYDVGTGKPIYCHLDKYASMDCCLAIYTLEVGNGKLYGSQGIGYVLYNTHVTVEQARNLISDALFLAGLVLVKGSGSGQEEAAISVKHPVAMISDGYEVVDVAFKVNPDAFFALDKHMSTLAEMQVGAFMPSQNVVQGSSKTAAEVNYVASIEQQIREGSLSRFFLQFLIMIGQIQKRIYSITNIKDALERKRSQLETGSRLVSPEKMEYLREIGVTEGFIEKDDPSDAVQAILNLMDAGLTAEEIYDLAHAPTNDVNRDVTGQDPQKIELVYSRYQNNPKIDQMALLEMDLVSKIGTSGADKLIIPGEDNTVAAEAVRMQLLEFSGLLQGEDIPVSGRDEDEIHMGVIIQKAKELLGTMNVNSATPQSIEAAENILKHFEGHVNNAVNKQMPEDALKQYVQFLEQGRAMIGQLKPMIGQMTQVAGGQLPEGVYAPQLQGEFGKQRSLSEQVGDLAKADAAMTSEFNGKTGLSNSPQELTPQLA